MKKLLALVLVAALATTASAANQVWFTSGGLGGPGQVLELTYPTGGTYSIPVEAWYRTDEGPMNNFGFDLGPDAPFTFAWGGYNIVMDTLGVVGGTPNQLTGMYGWNLTTFPLPAGTYQLFNFVLNVTLPDNATAVLDNGVINVGEFADLDGNYLDVLFGAGPTVVGEIETPIHSAMISVTTLPEPATLALLAIGALALIRRR